MMTVPMLCFFQINSPYCGDFALITKLPPNVISPLIRWVEIVAGAFGFNMPPKLVFVEVTYFLLYCGFNSYPIKLKTKRYL